MHFEFNNEFRAFKNEFKILNEVRSENFEGG